MYNKQGPVVIQGAMDCEISYFLEHLENAKEKTSGGFYFCEGKLNGHPAVISRTDVGMVNSAISTTTAILEFSPCAVINQGIAGAHSKDIAVGDIIVGENCIHINSFTTGEKDKDEGSNPFEWEYNSRAREAIPCDEELLVAAKKVEYEKDRTLFGTIGSGDIFNRETDRINWIHETQGTLCEEMEGQAAYFTCQSFSVPCIGVRVISNNEINCEPLDEETAIHSQKFVIELIDKYFAI